MTQGSEPPIVIIGAGIAGLAAAIRLGDAGLPVVLLEARNRLGGRIFTTTDAACNVPVELGAEFIHGLVPDTLEPLQESGARLTEVEGDSWCAFENVLMPCDFFGQVDSILEKMDDAAPDESFLSFLNRKFPPSPEDKKLEAAKRRALGYVSGFNAADPNLVGVHWLVAGMRAEEKHAGHRSFRSQNGYADLLDLFKARLEQLQIKIEFETVVERVIWKPGSVRIQASNGRQAFSTDAQQVLITVPLSILKSKDGLGAIVFDPPLPSETIAALDRLEMGKVIRVTLCFQQRFWDTIAPDFKRTSQKQRTLADMSFLLSDDELFPTWWTRMPQRDPVLTGWAPFRAAEALSGADEAGITNQALRTLGKLLGQSEHDLEKRLTSAYVHNWQKDPFSRGAYSYGKVGAAEAIRLLAEPMDHTLFFAGEATDTTGSNGTVHGAIASARRAVSQIVKSRPFARPNETHKS